MTSIFLTEQKHSHEVIYYFCAAEDAKRNNAAAILRVLLWQLVVRHQDAEKLIGTLHPWLKTEDQAEQVVSTAETLWHIFMELTNKEELTKTLCIIDGLDECAEESRVWLARKLVAWNKSRAKHTLRILVTSRPMVNLSSIAQVDLDAKDTQGVETDIMTFVSASVADLEKGIPMKDETLQRIKRTLVTRSESTFLWVGFAVAELRKAQTEMEVLRIIQSREGLPSGLAPIYGRILSSIGASHKQASIELLRWVTVSERPLSLDELASAVHCETGDGMSMYDHVKDRIRLCGPLLKYQTEERDVHEDAGQARPRARKAKNGQVNHTHTCLGDDTAARFKKTRRTVSDVRFVHGSFREYLTRPKIDADTELERFRVKGEAANLEAAQTCLQAIGKEGSLRVYAIQYWMYHAKRSGKLASVLIDQEPQFFQKQSSTRNEWWSMYWQLSDEPRQIPHGVGRAVLQETFQHLPRIHLAAWLGLEWWIEAIIMEEGSNINEIDHEGRTPLDFALSRGHTSTVHYLIRHGANIAFHKPTLLYAAEHNSLDVAQLLIQNGADLDAESKDDCYNSLMTAVHYGHHAMVKLFLVSGADVRHRNSLGETAMYALFRATHLCDQSFYEMMDLLLEPEPYPDPHATNTQGQTLLHIAARKGKYIQMSLDMGCDVAAVDGQGNTALHVAMVGGASMWAEKVLLQQGASIVARDGSGKTALHMAVQGNKNDGKTTLLDVLLGSGADPNCVDDTGSSLLHYWASTVSAGSVARSLLQHGADIEAYTDMQATPLHQAVKEGRIENAKILLEYGADVEAKGTGGRHALHFAVISNNGVATWDDFKMAEMLFHFGANLNARADGGQTPLHHSIWNNNVPMARYLLNLGADMEARDKDGWSALHIAALEGRASMVKLLLDSEADVNAMGGSNLTAFHLAAYAGHTKIVDMLAKSGADIFGHGVADTTLGRVRVTARDLAGWRRHTIMEQVLEEHGLLGSSFLLRLFLLFVEILNYICGRG